MPSENGAGVAAEMSRLELTTHVRTLGQTTRELLERVERLESRGSGTTEREADLTRSLGFAAAENRRLAGEAESARAAAREAGDELRAARAIRDRDRGRIGELESALAASDSALVERNAEVLELRREVERLRGEVETAREDLRRALARP